MFRPHPWDNEPEEQPVRRPRLAQRHGAATSTRPAWEQHGWDSDASSGIEGCLGGKAESDSDEGEAADPTECFVDEMVSLLFERTLNARQFCNLMFLIGRCGPDLKERAKGLGLRPGAPSGHYQRKCDTALGGYLPEDTTGYKLEVPGRQKNALGRFPHSLHVSAFHEELEADVLATPGFPTKLQEAIDDGRFPPCYQDHPVVAAHRGEAVLPVNLFIDAVPYSQNDSVIGFWLINCLTDRRYLFCALRKKVICDCGCRGWCTFYGVFHYIAWVLQALANKVMPLGRHDQKPWQTEDAERAAQAGRPLAIRAALLFVKGDWAEYAQTLGFPAWNNLVRPCFACNCSPANMQDTWGPGHCPWVENEELDYFQACERCELKVAVESHDQYLALKRLLKFHRKRSGVHGLALTADFLPLGLKKADRLEPSPELLDIGEFFTLESFPAHLTFWRAARESSAKHRNPLFSLATGVTPRRCLTVDILHALYLGTIKTYACHCVWFLLLSGVFGQAGTVEEERIESARLVLVHRLFQWYRAQDRGLTQVGDLTRKMLGTVVAKELKTKGAESWGILLFVADTLAGSLHKLKPEAAELLEGARALIELVTIFDACGAAVPGPERERCLLVWQRFLEISRTMPLVVRPKRHVLAHVLQRLHDHGNPKLVANWHDEALNKVLKAACRQVSQTTFEANVLARMRHLLAQRKRQRGW